jgi:hypothetical protein
VRATASSLLAILTGLAVLGASAPNPAPAGAPLVTSPPTRIVVLPAPFTIARCEVRLLPDNQISAALAVENHDLAMRTAVRLDGDVEPVEADGRPIISLEIPVRGAIKSLGSEATMPNPPGTSVARQLPARYVLSQAARVDCLPHRALFANGDVWLRMNIPTTGWAEPARCQALFDAGSFLLAEHSCLALVRPAAIASRAAKRDTASHAALDAKVRDIILAARASSRLGGKGGVGGTGDTTLLLESLDIDTATNDRDDLARLVPGLCHKTPDRFDACIREAQIAARTTYAAATPDERRVFLIRGKDSSDYRGMPCRTGTSQDRRHAKVVWLYCNRYHVMVAEYVFIDGKLKAVQNSQDAPKVVPG